MALPPGHQDDRFVEFRWCRCVGGVGRWIVEEIVEQGGAFDPFALVAEGDLDQPVDLQLLAVDLLAKLGVDGEQLGDLLAKVDNFLFQGHGHLSSTRQIRCWFARIENPFGIACGFVLLPVRPHPGSWPVASA
jgi:hypothetical protein